MNKSHCDFPSLDFIGDNPVKCEIRYKPYSEKLRNDVKEVK